LTICGPRSVEPFSTTINSQSWNICASTEHMVSAMYGALLNSGVMMLKVGTIYSDGMAKGSAILARILDNSSEDAFIVRHLFRFLRHSNQAASQARIHHV